MLYRLTWKVTIAGLVMMSLDIMNSFQDSAKVKITAETRPGFAIGSEMRTNACHQLQPSIMAASSISSMVPLKKPIRISIESGSVLTV